MIQVLQRANVGAKSLSGASAIGADHGLGEGTLSSRHDPRHQSLITLASINKHRPSVLNFFKSAIISRQLLNQSNYQLDFGDPFVRNTLRGTMVKAVKGNLQASSSISRSYG